MNEIVRYRKPGPKRAASPTFQILSLSGGGYRGLFTATILEDLEQKAGKPLRDCFDLVAGTSIGGILACGIAAGVPAETIRTEFERLGTRVFDRRLKVFGRSLFTVPKIGLAGARYSRSGLDEAVSGVLGSLADQTLAATDKPLLVPAVSSTTSEAVIFESGASAGRYADVALRDVAFATSAAPTYFPEHGIHGNAMVDGGIVANAPDVLATIRAMSFHGRNPSEIRLLSIGTTGAASGEVYRPGRSSGLLGWMVARNLFGLVVNAQQNLAIGLVADLLGSRNVRIDFAADAGRGKAIGLDKAGSVATDTLKGLAAQALERAFTADGSAITAMLRHEAK